MTIKHNQQIPHNHFRKDWQRRVRTHFDQPGRKLRRRNARLAKAASVAPRPVDKLRPVVRCPTIKYNRRVKPGKGFTFAELKEAGIPRKLARTIGIAVDHRRVNLSMESHSANVSRLKEYQSRLILFPRRVGQPTMADSKPEELKSSNTVRITGAALPISNVATKTGAFSERKISAMGKGEEAAYRRLREARSEKRLVGVREKRAKAKAEEASAAKK